jgi:serine/threonine protein kinase
MVGPGRIGIVMEHCDMSLAKHIQDRHTTQDINWAELVRLLMDGSRGLDFIHKHKKTVHGDVKPDNLLIQQGRLKVADFGLASVQRTMTKFTGELSRKGTCYFMAPEMLLGESKATSFAMDVWGFGCVIANVVTGNIPFASKKSQNDLELALKNKELVYLKEQACAGAPKKLLDLIDRCCHYCPPERPTMEKVEGELRGILESIQTRDGFGLPRAWVECGCSLGDPSWKMLECRDSRKDYQMIKSRLESEMGDSVTLLKVELNANVDQFRCYYSERHRVAEENAGDANEVWMWHATRSKPDREDDILKGGFDTNYCGNTI